MQCEENADLIATANYGLDFACIINKQNIYGIQCHPEKSHNTGTFGKFCGNILMLQPRIIPVLLVHDKGLVKTTKFKDPKYVGDPINAVKIFNEKEADELIVLDIDATVLGREPDYRLIENLATECRMPLCYGGGVKTAQQAERILGLGVEKVALGSVIFERPEIITELAETVGRECCRCA